MLACCIIDFPGLEFGKWIFAIFRRPQNSQGVDFSFSNLKQQFQRHFRYSTQCLLQIEDSPLEPKLVFKGVLVRENLQKL
jgi:hypothetical protein